MNSVASEVHTLQTELYRKHSSLQMTVSNSLQKAAKDSYSVDTSTREVHVWTIGLLWMPERSVKATVMCGTRTRLVPVTNWRKLGTFSLDKLRTYLLRNSKTLSRRELRGIYSSLGSSNSTSFSAVGLRRSYKVLMSEALIALHIAGCAFSSPLLNAAIKTLAFMTNSHFAMRTNKKWVSVEHYTEKECQPVCHPLSLCSSPQPFQLQHILPPSKMRGNCQWDLSLNASGWNMPISDAGVISTGKYPVTMKPWLPRRPRISNNSSVQSGSTRGTWKLVPSKNKGRMFFQPWENSSRVKPSASSAGSFRNVTSSGELVRVLFILYSCRMSSTMVSRFTDACIIVL